jgi:hypothetical protein
MRTGAVNAVRIKAKLREIGGEIAGIETSSIPSCPLMANPALWDPGSCKRKIRNLLSGSHFMAKSYLFVNQKKLQHMVYVKMGFALSITR